MTTNLQARPTLYRGIQMRSRLEAGFAQWLDCWRFSWEYEPIAFAAPEGQYLPDFRINNLPVLGRDNVAQRTAYVEVKSDRAFDEQRDAILRRVLIIRSSEPDAVLMLVTPTRTLRVENWWQGGHHWTTCGWSQSSLPLTLVLPIPADCNPMSDGFWKG